MSSGLGRTPDFTELRRRMVAEQLASRGIEDERVLDVMGSVPRESFVPEPFRDSAYDDGALPIGRGQTISQPWIVATICQALELSGDEVVLEIGTGSGYSAAILSSLARRVVTIEREPSLARQAKSVIDALGIENVEAIVADGTLGWPAEAPYGGIAVHAGAPEVPAPLLEQLADGAWLVVPVSSDGAEVLTRTRRRSDGALETEEMGPCRFVPLIGEAGYAGQ